MSKFIQVFSTGRCGTQFLARSLAGLHSDAVVVHEPGGAHYRSRKVYRQPEAMYFETLGREVVLQRTFIRIEKTVQQEKTFISFGWPAYAWLPYFLKRFAGNFSFAHLVRNPFDSAASHCTHDLMQPSGVPILDDNKIWPTDARITHTQLAADAASFGVYERQLFHWLEVNRYLQGFHDQPGFLGVFRFEQLFSASPEPMNRFCSLLLDRPTAIAGREPFDRVHRGLISDLTAPNAALLATVQALALELGYSETDLAIDDRLEALRQRYKSKRHAQPFDPRIAVIDRK